MKRKTKQTVGILLGALLCLAVTGIDADASGNVIYTGGSEAFIFSPGSEHSPTDLFTELKSVMPGDSIGQEIIIKNSSKKKINIRVYMRSLGADEESEDFLSQMKLKVVQDGRNTLFDAGAHETAQLTDWTYLGTVYPNRTIPLTLTLEVPLSMGDEYQDAVGLLDWEFKVEEIPGKKDEPRSPGTGDPFPLGVLAAGLVIGAAGIVWVVKRNSGIRS